MSSSLTFSLTLLRGFLRALWSAAAESGGAAQDGQAAHRILGQHPERAAVQPPVHIVRVSAVRLVLLGNLVG